MLAANRSAKLSPPSAASVERVDMNNVPFAHGAINDTPGIMPGGVKKTPQDRLRTSVPPTLRVLVPTTGRAPAGPFHRFPTGTNPRSRRPPPPQAARAPCRDRAHHATANPLKGRID